MRLPEGRVRQRRPIILVRLLVRLMVGIVFLSEWIQKFLYPAELEAGRFAKMRADPPHWTLCLRV